MKKYWKSHVTISLRNMLIFKRLYPFIAFII